MPRRHHHLQHLPESCVAAAIVILHSKAGRQLPEATVRAELGDPPMGLRRAAGYGQFRVLNFADPADVDILLATVQSTWCAVTVGGGPAAAAAAVQGWSTPHGALAVPLYGNSLANTALPHHVIVLTSVHRTTGRLHYLDPYFQVHGQPGEIDLSAFIDRWWMGDLLAL